MLIKPLNRVEWSELLATTGFLFARLQKTWKCSLTIVSLLCIQQRNQRWPLGISAPRCVQWIMLNSPRHRECFVININWSININWKVLSFQWRDKFSIFFYRIWMKQLSEILSDFKKFRCLSKIWKFRIKVQAEALNNVNYCNLFPYNNNI